MLVLQHVTLAALLVAPAFAQSSKFEVASIRPCEAGDPAGPRRSPDGNPTPGGVYLPCQTVRDLIRSAYGTYQAYIHTLLLVPIEGGPSWINAERYTINAKAAGDPGPTVTRGPMMQALLEDRFKLKIRRETREVPVYALTVATNGPKLQPFQEGTCVDLKPGPVEPNQKPICGTAKGKLDGSNLTVDFAQMTVDEFAKNLGANSGPNILDRPVADKTGIAGIFNFRLTFAPDETTPGATRRLSGQADPPAGAPSDPSGPSIFTAIQEQLGLKLEPAKGPQDFLVIESVERPSAN